MLKKKAINRKLSWITLLSALIFVCGCDKQMKIEDGYVPEVAEMQAEEFCEPHFFPTNDAFDISKDTCARIERLLKDAKVSDVENLEFMIISNHPVPVGYQEKIKKIILYIMYKNGFIPSRITDKGVCVYEGAKTGIRIGILQYNLKEPDCSAWSEYIGDTDTNKNLPKHGVSRVYNLQQMIANKADLVSPRIYKGVIASTAVSGMENSSGGD